MEAGLLMSLNISAQILQSNTRVLNKPQGEPAFELNEGEQLYTYPDDDGWHKVRKEAWVRAVDLIENKFLGQETNLMNKDGDKIGVVIKELKVKEKRLVEGFRDEDRYVVVLEGYLFRTKFKEGSIPEKKINELLAIKNRNTQAKGLKELFELYGFEEKEYGDFTAYAMRETNKTAAEEKDFRIIVLMRGSTSVYCVLTNGQNVTAPKIKATFEDGDFKGIYMTKPPAKTREKIEGTIMYDFLAL